MTTVDLFGDALPGDPSPPAASSGSAHRSPARRAPRRTAQCGGDPHYDLAMRAARHLPRTDRREMTARLICHHLRCMLEDESRVAG